MPIFLLGRVGDWYRSNVDVFSVAIALTQRAC
jgi:hypothetical protein